MNKKNGYYDYDKRAIFKKCITVKYLQKKKTNEKLKILICNWK